MACDEFTRAWRPSEPWFRTGLVLAAAALVAVPLISGKDSRIVIGGRLVVLAVLALLVVRFWTHEKKGILVAVHPEGVFLRTHWREVLLPWCTIHRLSLESRLGFLGRRHDLRLHLVDGQVVSLNRVLLWKADKIFFQSHFALLRQRYTNATAAGEPGLP